MAMTAKQLAFIFGLLGNIVSFIVLLTPISTFYKIYKRKTSEGFEALPYCVGLLSASLLLYYASLQSGKFHIISINVVASILQVLYLVLFVIFSPRDGKVTTIKMVALLNVASLGMVMLLTFLFSQGHKRIIIVGYITAGVNISIFAAPLSIIKRVIQTRSVEFVPFNLSFTLTICAILWFFYGIFVRDYFIAIPNVVGFVVGIVQMFLYVIYKYLIKKRRDETTLERHEETTERPLYVPTQNNEPTHHHEHEHEHEHEPRHKEKDESKAIVSTTSPRGLDYFTEYHPMFMEKDEYLS